jgi:branched-chain amino acid transport system ATP-binding protein
VALARALIVGTRLLLLDEPFEGVAPALSRRLAEVIGMLRGREVAVLIAQSDLNHSARLLDREYTIERGANRVPPEPQTAV